MKNKFLIANKMKNKTPKIAALNPANGHWLIISELARRIINE